VPPSTAVTVSGGSIALNEMTPGDAVSARLLPDPTSAGLYALDSVSDLSVTAANPLDGTITATNTKKQTISFKLPQGTSVTATVNSTTKIRRINGQAVALNWVKPQLLAGFQGFYNQRTNKVFDLKKVQVLKAVRLSWSTPAPIIYGTSISPAQLTARASVPGSFTYSPSTGSLLQAGSNTLTATFKPTDGTYFAGLVRTTLKVEQAAPTLSWEAPGSITYGTPLSDPQLGATANVPGTFIYTPGAGTVLEAGNQTLTATFTPSDSTDYVSGMQVQTSLAVSQATPVLSWPAPDPISYGTALTEDQLDAWSNVPGTFAYSPDMGTILGTGSQILTATFTPTDTADYVSGTQVQASLAVNQAVPALSWAQPGPITYGTPLSGAQLDATSDVPGQFTYSPDTGTILGAGLQTITAVFTPADTTDYVSGGQVAVSITVNQAIPTITWNAPSTIVAGTPLSDTQLNATASVPGILSYSPPAGTILPAGSNQLNVTFTPTDTADYASTQAQVAITVTSAAAHH
jgi:hypothetical protein